MLVTQQTDTVPAVVHNEDLIQGSLEIMGANFLSAMVFKLLNHVKSTFSHGLPGV